MFLRTNSVPKSKKAFGSPLKQFSALKTSIKHYEAKLKNLQKKHALSTPSSSSIKNSSRGHNLGGFKSQQSPSTLFADFKCDPIFKSSDTSNHTLGKNSSDESSSYDRTAQSPVLKKHKPTTLKRNEERSPKCQERINSKPRLGQLFDMHLEENISIKGKQADDLERKMEKLQKYLRKKYKAEMESKKEEMIEEFKKELDAAKRDIAQRLKAKHKELWNQREIEIKRSFHSEILSLQNEHERRMREKIVEIAGDCERKLGRSNEEILWLRKQNESLKRQLEDCNARVDAKNFNKFDSATGGFSIEHSNYASEGSRAYSQLQEDYLTLKNKQTNTMCSKCKSFTTTNTELSSKISRIRAYIDSQPQL